MKRIYNDIPLQSVLYLVGGLQEIEIRDYKNSYEVMMKGEHKIVYAGLFRDARLSMNYKIEHAKVRGIDAVGDKLIFAISTAMDEVEVLR